MSELWCTVVEPQGPGRGDAEFRVTAGEPLLSQMRLRGEKSLPIGCRSGGCGICRVEILSGDYTTKVMSRRHVSLEDAAAGIVLACRVFPLSDLVIRPAAKPDTHPEVVLT